jgi:hypothetical protein
MYRRIRINDLAVLRDERDDEVRAAADTQDFARLARRRMPEAFVLIVGASLVSHAEAHRLLSPDADWYRAFAHYAHLVHGDGGLQNAYPRARWMVYQVVHGAQLGATALAQLRLLMQGRSCDALAHYALLVYCCEHKASVGYTYDAINDLALELGSPGYAGGELEEGEIPSRVEQSLWPSVRGWQFAKRAMAELQAVTRIARSLPHQRFQIQYRNDAGRHQTLDMVSARDMAGDDLYRIAVKHGYCGPVARAKLRMISARDMAGDVLYRIAVKHGYCGPVARAKLRMIREGKQLDLARPCARLCRSKDKSCAVLESRSTSRAVNVP